jgi:biopolymer transport protein ExbD
MNIVREIGAVLLPFSKSADKRSPKTSVLQISVLSSGRVLLDGKKATVAKVRKALAKASSEKGTVWYYRESGEGEPPSQAVEIVKLVVENRLPISLSSRPDFSDYIDDEGQSRPRK